MSYTHDPQYKGAEYAIAYWRMWRQRTHIYRRVDTYELLDAEAVQLSATFDIGNESLWAAQMVDGEPAIGLGTHPVPIMMLKKQPLFDLDCLGSQGRPAHFCRRYENIDICAHIIVGMLLDSKRDIDDPKQLVIYQGALSYLGFERDSTDSAKERFRAELVEEVKAVMGQGQEVLLSRVQDFLSALIHNYIQCVWYEYSNDTQIHILKIRTISMLQHIDVQGQTSPISEQFREVHRRVTTLLRTRRYRESLRLAMKGMWARIMRGFQSLSITSLAVIVTILGEDLPNHIRVVSAKGTTIDEITLRAQDKTPYEGDVLATRHSERAALLLRGIPPNAYELILRLTPKSLDFIFPGFVVSVLQLTLLSTALLVGPEVVSRNAVAFTGTAIVSPFVSTLFLVRESEHALVTRLLGAPRSVLLILSFSAVIAGAFISLLPKQVCISSEKPDMVVSCTFYVLTVACTWSLLAAFGYALLLLRMWRIRRFTSWKSSYIDRSRRERIGGGSDAKTLRQIQDARWGALFDLIYAAYLLMAPIVCAASLFVEYCFDVWHPSNPLA